MSRLYSNYGTIGYWGHTLRPLGHYTPGIDEPGSPVMTGFNTYELGFLMPLISGLGSVVAAAAPVITGIQQVGRIFGGGPASPVPTAEDEGSDYSGVCG